MEGASSIELARDGRHLAVRGWTSRSPSHVLIFDTDSGEQVGSFDAEANFVLQAASLSPDGTQLVLAGAHETYEADRWESKATRSALEIRVYDWKSRRVVARGFAPLSWDNFGRVSMIPGGEIVVQLAGGVSCYVPDS